LFALYAMTAPQNHSEAEDVYDFALRVEQGTFGDQAGVNRVLALPVFGVVYKAAKVVGYTGRAFPLMIFINRMLAVGCVLFFLRIVSYRRCPACPVQPQSGISDPGYNSRTSGLGSLFGGLGLAFSYGFWRYANEAETYILASVFVLGAWCFVLCPLRSSRRFLSSVLCSLISALGILVHLLNLIPLLLIIPLFYLLSKEWKKALAHGIGTGLLVILGYAICSPWLDFSELGAQHHAAEGGLGLKNLLRGGMAFGQCLLSGNFLFGFESFRELLSGLFPSRMLDEEYFMASKMPFWIAPVGVITVLAVLWSAVWGGGKCALECGGSTPLLNRSNASEAPRSVFHLQFSSLIAVSICSLVWLILYAVAVLRTEAGSPELWIMGLIPFWLLVSSLLQGAYGKSALEWGGSIPLSKKYLWTFVGFLFLHNLVAGLLPVMKEESDYHAQKGKWLVDHVTDHDLVLSSLEPVMIFYLDYHLPKPVLSSAVLGANQLEQMLGKAEGDAYALNNVFEPLSSMKVRYPALFERMMKTGQILRPEFEQVVEDEFGGIYILRVDAGGQKTGN
jgi:hypothetical protein